MALVEIGYLLLSGGVYGHARLIPRRGLRDGEIDQARALFHGRESLPDAFCTATPAMEPAEVRTLLAKFGLGAEHVMREAITLSPIGQPKSALYTYDGTHDRRLLEAVRVTRRLELDDWAVTGTPVGVCGIHLAASFRHMLGHSGRQERYRSAGACGWG